MYTRPPPYYPDDNFTQPPPPPPPNSPPEAAGYELGQAEVFAPNFLNAEALAALEKTAAGEDQFDEGVEGLIFGAPIRPKKHEQLQDRYHPVVTQVTRLLMRHGQLSKAQTVGCICSPYVQRTEREGDGV